MDDYKELLKPCPFCGGSAFLSLYKVTVPSNRYYGLWRVGCGSCRVLSYREFFDDAIKFWNTRQPEPEKQEPIGKGSLADRIKTNQVLVGEQAVIENLKRLQIDTGNEK